MATLVEINKLFSRFALIQGRLAAREGDGCSWPATFENGETYTYVFHGIMGFDEVDFFIESLFVWLWNMKDYIKAYSQQFGKPLDWVELKVNADPNLCMCADLANGIKHARLSKSRSGRFATMGILTYTIPQESVTAITYTAFKIETEIRNQGNVILGKPILDNAGNKCGDAFQLAGVCIQIWENIVAEIDVGT